MSTVRRQKWRHQGVNNGATDCWRPIVNKRITYRKRLECQSNDCGIFCQTVETVHVVWPGKSKIDSAGSSFSGAPSQRLKLTVGWRKRFRLHWADKLSTELTWSEPRGLFSLGRRSVARLYCQIINEVDHLKQVLISCWDTISQELINWLLTSGWNNCCWSSVHKVDILNIACIDSDVNWTFWLIL